ncbi:MAG: type IV toxin-antitoxin system AbiEi family antitoxin domain-containing protein [Candidatus Delongbacteria bacterium]
MISNKRIVMSRNDKIFQLFEDKKMIRSRDVEAIGIPREYLLRMVSKGLVIRVARGMYCLSDENFKGYESYVEAVMTAPNGVICLISALHFYSTTTQISDKIWMAVKKGSWRPRSDSVQIKYNIFSDNSYNYGIEIHKINNIEIPVYSVAKTVADCFKFRNKIGLDVAIEALKEAIRSKKAGVDEIYEAAKVCRVSRVIQPYLESIV